MKERRNSKYARQEIGLAKSALEKNPDNDIQKDRLAWWSAYLGDIETAWQYAVSDHVKAYVKRCETS